MPWALSARQHDSQRAAHMPSTVYDLHSALVAVTASSRVRERRSLAQDLRGGSEPRKVWLLQERQPLERGHEPDECVGPYHRPVSGVRASKSECSYERPGAEHRQPVEGEFVGHVSGKRRQAQVSDRCRPLSSHVNAAPSIVQVGDTR